MRIKFLKKSQIKKNYVAGSTTCIKCKGIYKCFCKQKKHIDTLISKML